MRRNLSSVRPDLKKTSVSGPVGGRNCGQFGRLQFFFLVTFFFVWQENIVHF